MKAQYIDLGTLSCRLPLGSYRSEVKLGSGNYVLTHEFNLDGVNMLPVYCIVDETMRAQFAWERGRHNRLRFVASGWYFAGSDIPVWVSLRVHDEHHQSDMPQLKIYGPHHAKWADGRRTVHEVPKVPGAAVATITKA